MELHIFLVDEDDGNNFIPAHFQPLQSSVPHIGLIFHATQESLEAALPDIGFLDTWYFDQSWYAKAPKLQHVFTPAAGKDWVHEDPAGRVKTWYGKFHGPMIAETMLGLILHFNREMTAMLNLQKQHIWDRNRQRHTTLLRNQTVLILGYGNIGKTCASHLTALGARVLGHQRQFKSGIDADSGAHYIHDDDLSGVLPEADHVVMLLPGSRENYGFMNRQKLEKLKPGSFIYNFGRGTTLLESDVLWALDNGLVAGAGLDVTEIEPLPANSLLWDHPGVILLPHSSCVFQEYQPLHVMELSQLLQGIIAS